MIDLHTHILPKIDDGAASMRVSLDMLDAAQAIGFTAIAATPHLVGHPEPTYESAVQNTVRELVIPARERGIALVPGYEVRLSPGVPEWLRGGAPMALGESRAVLVDLPFIDWPYFAESVLFDVQTSGFQPVLAHPERYPRIQRDPSVGLALAERGIVLQVTIASLVGLFGKPAMRAAEALLWLGAVHLVATDAHSTGRRMATVPAALTRLEGLVGAEGVRQLTTEAPAALLAGEPLPAPVRAAGRSWRDWRPTFR